MSSILLSIKPEYVVKILNGQKQYEYRKRLATNIDTIYIYCTYPTMKVVAKAAVINVLSASPTALWERTKTLAGISRQNYRQYFKDCKTAFAYQLGDIHIFEPQKTLDEFGISAAPQSFIYIHENNIAFANKEQGASNF